MRRQLVCVMVAAPAAHAPPTNDPSAANGVFMPTNAKSEHEPLHAEVIEGLNPHHLTSQDAEELTRHRRPQNDAEELAVLRMRDAFHSARSKNWAGLSISQEWHALPPSVQYRIATDGEALVEAPPKMSNGSYPRFKVQKPPETA